MIKPIQNKLRGYFLFIKTPQSKPPVNWWYAQALEGPNTDLVPKGTWKFDTALQFRAAA